MVSHSCLVCSMWPSVFPTQLGDPGLNTQPSQGHSDSFSGKSEIQGYQRVAKGNAPKQHLPTLVIFVLFLSFPCDTMCFLTYLDFSLKLIFKSFFRIFSRVTTQQRANEMHILEPSCLDPHPSSAT